ncbi:MAG: hypothetical protein U1A77_08260 [Pirellulales bacterium]
MDYSHLDSKRVAVVFSWGTATTVFRGICHCLTDELLGNVLRVVDSDDADGLSAVILQPSCAQLSINAGDAYGCDFRVEVARMIDKVDQDDAEFPAWNDSSVLGKG